MLNCTYKNKNVTFKHRKLTWHLFSFLVLPRGTSFHLARDLLGCYIEQVMHFVILHQIYKYLP